MCLAVPLEIERINDNSTAMVKQGGSFLEVDVSLLDNAAVGDFVIVHAGYAIEILDFDEAEARLEMFDKLKE